MCVTVNLKWSAMSCAACCNVLYCSVFGECCVSGSDVLSFFKYRRGFFVSVVVHVALVSIFGFVLVIVIRECRFGFFLLCCWGG